MVDSSLIRSKYYMPRANPNLLSRGRMLRKLDCALKRALTLVIAPIGYGKTTAVHEWVEKSGARAAWLSLDEGDNDPILFWKYLCAACEAFLPGLLERTQYTFSSGQLLEANIHINILIDELAGCGGTVVLVLDDLHTILSAQIWKGISHLLTYLPTNAHLIFISRTEPAMDLNLLEIRSQVLRIGPRDLRFRQDEIADFYAKRDCAFGCEVLKRIENYTEGWPAAMVAIAASVQNDSTKRNVLCSCAETETDIYRYLMNEVIESYSPEKRAFLLKISILEPLTGDICAEVTGEMDALRFFEEMRGKNEFLAGLGDNGGAYRLHPLLKDFLMEKLRKLDPEGFLDLHAKAALCYRQRGMLSLAVSHYLSAGCYAQAFELIQMQLGTFACKNEFDTARLWLDQIPDELKKKSVRVAVFYSMYYAQSRDFRASRQWLSRAGELLSQDCGGESDSRERTLFRLAAINLLIREGDEEKLRALLRSDDIQNGSTFRTIDYMDLNDSSIYLYRSPVRIFIRLFADDREAFQKLKDCSGIFSTHRPGFGQLAAGEYFYEKNRTEDALPLLLNAAENAQSIGYPGVLVPAMAGISRIKCAQGDMAGALSILEECESSLQAIRKPHWNDLVGALKARYWIASGNMDRATRWLRANKLSIFSQISTAREFELIVHARVLWAARNSNDAEMLLLRLLSFAQEEDRRHSMVEVLNLLAMIACQKGNTRMAAEYMEKSLSIGLREGYVRSYLDEQTPMLVLLKQASGILEEKKGASPELMDFASSLVSQIQKETGKPSDRAAAGCIRPTELLTEKELKVLELLCAACSNEEIGKKLNIGQRTVKAHTASIYGKLGVKTRTQCVKLMYEAGFPPPGMPLTQ